MITPALFTLWFSADAVTLDRAAIVARVRERSAVARRTAAEIAEARAWQEGAHAPAQQNPELTLFAGPRLDPASAVRPFADVTAGLTWPIDFSGAPSARATVASRHGVLAEAEAELAIEVAIEEALDVWLRSLALRDRLAIEREREELDRAFLSTLRARRSAGTIGDGDLGLGEIILAESVARRTQIEGEAAALLALLGQRTGLDTATTVVLAGALATDALPPETQFATQAQMRADVAQADGRVLRAQADSALQERLAAPIVRVTAAGGRDVELYAHGGIELPLPIYQRNQTQRAVSAAHQALTEVEKVDLVARIRSEVHGAYARALADAEAARALDAVTRAIADAETLATRSYELGQAPLANALMVRRETYSARVAQLDARLRSARSRLLLEVTAGLVR